MISFLIRILKSNQISYIYKMVCLLFKHFFSVKNQNTSINLNVNCNVIYISNDQLPSVFPNMK